MEMHRPEQEIKDANIALQLLKEGNERFVKDELCDKHCYKADREVLNSGQHPFAVVICCSDSRVTPEIFFDQRLGDLFIIRNAGNIIDTTTLGSLEYAIEHLGSPLIVVCGHSKCGAVTAAYSGGELPPHIQSIADRIKPAVADGGDLDEVIHHNVEHMVAHVKNDEAVQRLGTTVVGAYYDVHTGVVSWM